MSQFESTTYSSKTSTYSIQLFQYPDDEAIVELGISVFDALHGTVTAKAICQLMLLAYNLKDANDSFVFGGVAGGLIGEEEEFENISNSALLTAHPTAQRGIEIPENSPHYYNRVGKALAFLAASFMRLYTKSADNVTMIHGHLRVRFQNFYDFPFPLHGFFPENNVTTSIKSQIDVNVILKNTFYNLLYAGEDPEIPGKQLKEFLYGSHTAYTGMHCYVLFLKCMVAYKTDNRTLANILRTKAFETELDGIAVIFNTLFGTETEPAKHRQMWRYARIFDNAFFTILQTKTCPLFTAALAHLYHSVVPATGRQCLEYSSNQKYD
ncbi:hypothetical protein DH2020_037231 [Rehmannia glutinosa]|uniref:Uncharacterized protein n=1 Tax=Rehmannia glutinosa TaxID=99300 RepID=A0ABR0V3K9_REHGL